MDRTIEPAQSLRGTLSVPGDKSISHRALMLASIAEGETNITGLSEGADVRSTAGCLRALGVSLEVEGTEARVFGCGLRGLRAPAEPLDAGNSGTAMRLLLGLLAGQRFESALTGDASLQKRPMNRVIRPLEAMGAEIEATGKGVAPLKILGRGLKGIDYALPVASAQVQSALLLAGLYADGTTRVSEPGPIRDHTERMLAYLGVSVSRDEGTVALRGGQSLRASELDVPGDPSSAAFWLAAGALAPGAEIAIENVCTNPTRTGFFDVLARMGAALERERERVACGEPRADLRVAGSRLRAVTVDGALVPRLIDELPLVAVLATQAEGKTVVREAEELRVKETDRVEAVSANLRAMGAELEENHDGWVIPGPQALRGATVESFGDHRVAMAFAVAALVANGPTTIRGAEWADISYPGFFEELERLRE